MRGFNAGGRSTVLGDLATERVNAIEPFERGTTYSHCRGHIRVENDLALVVDNGLGGNTLGTDRTVKITERRTIRLYIKKVR